jgi:hypothetical protein
LLFSKVYYGGQIKKAEIGGAVAYDRGEKYKILVIRQKGNKPLGRPRNR